MSCALVLGGAECVWEDAERLYEMVEPDVVVAANDIGCHWPEALDFWCTLHPERLPDWEAIRKQNGHPNGYQTVARRGKVDVLTQTWGGGSSGLLATVQALQVADKVVLCGMPMDTRKHFGQSHVHHRKRSWPSADSHWRAWKREQNAVRLIGRVKSMSGRTRILLGAPTREWLNG